MSKTRLQRGCYEKITDRKILLSAILAASLLVALIWGFTLDGPLPKTGITAKDVVFLDKELTGFSLKSTGGETLSLVDARGKTITQVTTMAMQADQVMFYGQPDYVLSAGSADIPAGRWQRKYLRCRR